MRGFYCNKYFAVTNKEKTIGKSEYITEVISESVENGGSHKRLL
jgi:hypothetical protein